MNLKEALITQGNDEDVIDDIIDDMCYLISNGRETLQVLDDYELSNEFEKELNNIYNNK